MAERYFNQFVSSFHKKLVVVDFSFTVASTNANGVSGFTGEGISKIFAYSTAPASGNLVPQGYFQVFLKDNYYSYFSMFGKFTTPLTGSNINISSGLTQGVVYTITSVGTSTAANWQAVGLPVGITPAVGVSFIASTSSAGTGTGVVQAESTNGSLVSTVEGVGNPTTTISPQPYGNGYILFRSMAPSFSYNSGTPANSTVPMVVTQPADGSLFRGYFYLSNSSVLVNGS